MLQTNLESASTAANLMDSRGDTRPLRTDVVAFASFRERSLKTHFALIGGPTFDKLAIATI